MEIGTPALLRRLAYSILKAFFKQEIETADGDVGVWQAGKVRRMRWRVILDIDVSYLLLTKKVLPPEIIQLVGPDILSDVLIAVCFRID